MVFCWSHILNCVHWRAWFLEFFSQACAKVQKTFQVSHASAAAKVIDPLSRGEIKLEPLKAFVDKEFCSGCDLCEPVCPYTATEMKIERLMALKDIQQKLLKRCAKAVGYV